MTVIAVMPAAGLLISVGKLIQMAGADMNAVLTLSLIHIFPTMLPMPPFVRLAPPMTAAAIAYIS